jgi:4-hydroxy-tetrahydrodipicolinate synthase
MTLTGLSGVYPILATPFRTDRSVDEDDLGHLIDFIVTSGADGIVFPGVASEFETLESAERTRLVDKGRALRRGARAVGRRRERRQCSGCRRARAPGARSWRGRGDGRCAVGPRDTEGRDPRLLRPHRGGRRAGDPAERAPPAGCALSADDVIELVRTIDGVRYVKEETLPCGQRITQVLAAQLPALAGVFGGAGGRYITDELARGACGTMPACELTDLHARQFALHRAGDVDGVRMLYYRMLPLLNFQAVFRMAMTKEVLRMRGVIESIGVRAAGPQMDTGDRIELVTLLNDIADLLPAGRGRPLPTSP